MIQPLFSQVDTDYIRLLFGPFRDVSEDPIPLIHPPSPFSRFVFKSDTEFPGTLRFRLSDWETGQTPVFHSYLHPLVYF